MHEYYFAVNTDDDKGVPFGPVNKDNLDVSRLIIDFTSWLDENENVTELSYMTIRANPTLPLPSWQANYPLDETSATPPADTYPLVFTDYAVIHAGKAVILDLAAGTPQLSYAVSFTATAGLSRRRRLVDILMVVDKPLNSDMVAVGAPVPVHVYPLVIYTSTNLPVDFSGRVYVSNTTGAPITVTLPPSPVMGQFISFLDIVGNFNSYPVTFVGAPGSLVFEAGASSVTSNTPYEDIEFEWTGTYWEWDVAASSVAQSSPGWGLVSDYGGVGVGDETSAIAAAELSAYGYINLQAKTIQTTALADSLVKKYFNGRLIAAGDAGDPTDVHLFWPAADDAFERNHWKSFRLAWGGAKILWLGTSIPHQGAGVDGYPEQVAIALGATVSNMAWSGSHMFWDPNFNAFNETEATANLSSLSMTEDDRLRGLALYPGSGYDDASPFMPVGGPSTMTADFRISQQFNSTSFDTVVLDHAHNDRARPEGVLNPVPLPITSITKGTTTAITLAGPGLVAVGEGVVLQVTGITMLHEFAGMVMSVAGNTFVLNINSSGFAGTFSNGSVIKYDRRTITGSCQFLLHYIRSCAIRRGIASPLVILAGAPSEYTGEITNTIDAGVHGSARILKDIAKKWQLPFFDIAFYLDVSQRDQRTYFEDGVHPLSFTTRQVIANYWVQWMRGGAPMPLGPQNVLMRGGALPHLDGHAAEYSDVYGGFLTQPYRVRNPVVVLTEDFKTGTDGWTLVGTAPVVAAAPWGAGDSSIKFFASGGALSYMTRPLALTAGWQLEFDVWVPTIPPVSGVPVATINLVELRTAGSYYLFQLVVAPGSATIGPRISYFTSPGDIGLTSVPPFAAAFNPAVKYHIKIMGVRATAGYAGTMIMWLNNVLVAGPAVTSDTTQSDVTTMFLGVNFYNTGGAVTVNVSNVVASTLTIDDYTTRYNGTLTVGAQTVTVINGVITQVV